MPVVEGRGWGKAGDPEVSGSRGASFQQDGEKEKDANFGHYQVLRGDLGLLLNYVAGEDSQESLGQ